MVSPRRLRADWQSAEESDGGVVGPRLRALNGRRGGRPLLLQRSVKITSPRDAPPSGDRARDCEINRRKINGLGSVDPIIGARQVSDQGRYRGDGGLIDSEGGERANSSPRAVEGRSDGHESR